MLRRLSYFILISVGLLSVFFAFELHKVVFENKEMKQDLAEINRVNYELFNIQLWKEQSLKIFRKKIREFQISDETYDVLDQQIQIYLNQMYERYFVSGELIDLIADKLEQSGNINPMFLNIIKTNITEQVGQLDLVSQIPGLSAQVITEIRANEPMLKQYLQQELLRLLQDDDFSRYFDPRRVIYQKYAFNNNDQTEDYLQRETQNLQGIIKYKITLLVLILLSLFVFSLLMRKHLGFDVFISSLTLISILLLVLGISLPMIDIDARLNSFTFSLLNEPIEFDEQVIYYQSKSIIEVTQTLWRSGGIDLKLVGVLVLLFSIVFPFFKLVLSALYLFVDKIKRSHIAQNIIFHLGKWSMADVFVVALFMAYIGMYGLIASQLNSISQNQGGFAIETINYSQLAPGALFFTSYTILSVFIGILINREALHQESDLKHNK